MSVEDWRKPGVDRIISGTIDAVLKGNRSIVILHDGGADRSQTVAALPKIIEELRARNFEFVPVSDLMGIPQAAIMPPVSYGDGILRRLGKFGFLASTCLYIVGVRLLTIIRNHFRREPDGMRARSQAGV